MISMKTFEVYFDVCMYVCMAGAVIYLNSGADPQVRSIQRLVNSFLDSCAEGDEGEGDEVLAMRQDFRKQYRYDPWTSLSDVISLASNH